MGLRFTPRSTGRRSRVCVHTIESSLSAAPARFQEECRVYTYVRILLSYIWISVMPELHWDDGELQCLPGVYRYICYTKFLLTGLFILGYTRECSCASSSIDARDIRFHLPTSSTASHAPVSIQVCMCVGMWKEMGVHCKKLEGSARHFALSVPVIAASLSDLLKSSRSDRL